MSEWVVGLTRKLGLTLYAVVDPDARVDPGKWMRRPAVVDHGADWAAFGDLSHTGEAWWVMGTNGVSVSGPALIVGVERGTGRLVALRTDQLGRIQVWHRNTGGPRVLVVR